MAGTSGCIPDHQVNFFGQLCNPPQHSSAMSPHETETRDDIQSSAGSALTPLRTAQRVPRDDRITELFKENQKLIRGLSPENVETYLATVKEVFVEVRRIRRNACAERLPQGQSAGYQEFERDGRDQTEHRDQEVKDRGQRQDQQEEEDGPRHQDQQEENDRPGHKDQQEDEQRPRHQDQQEDQHGAYHCQGLEHPPAAQHGEQRQDESQSQIRQQPQQFQSQAKYPTRHFVITHYSQDIDSAGSACQNQLQRAEDATYCMD